MRLKAGVANAGLTVLVRYAYDQDENGNPKLDSRQQRIPRSFKSGKLGYRLAKNIRRHEAELKELLDAEIAFERRKFELATKEEMEDGQTRYRFDFSKAQVKELEELMNKAADIRSEVVEIEPIHIPEDMLEGGDVDLFFKCPWVFDEDYEAEPIENADADEAEAAS